MNSSPSLAMLKRARQRLINSVSRVLEHVVFLGDRYLNTLHATGDVVRPRSNRELKELLAGILDREVRYRVHGNMAFASSPRVARLQ